MYGPSTRFTRKPGESFAGSGSLSMWRTNAAAFFASSGFVLSPLTISTSCSSGTGLKKWMPTRREGSFSAVEISASLRLEVLVARIASGLAIDSSLANSERFASRFSKMASISTSAWRAPLPLTSGISRSSASRSRRGSRSRRLKSSAARFTAGARRSGAVSCSVTRRPRIAQIAAMSPPITPAPTTCTWRGANGTPLATDFRRSCRKKMRIRFAVVGWANSDSIEHDGSLAAANGSPSYFFHSSRIA